jgi:hypothetical protein
MKNVGRFHIGIVAVGVGLCGAAMALSPAAAAAPFVEGGYDCIQTAAGGAPITGACVPAAAPVADMSGVPMALPGPVPVAPPVPVVPVAPPVPVPIAPPVPIVPAGAPVAAGAPAAAGAPIDLARGYAGKGDPILPVQPGAPVAGQPAMPGPTAGG